MLRWFCVLALWLPLAGVRAATPLPGNSIYHVQVRLTDQDGRRQMLSARRGRPQIVTMFYSSCQMVCPMIMDTLRLTRNALDPATQARIDLLAVSFDPARDDVATLKAYAGKRGLAARAWTLARAEPVQVRQLSGVLGLQYRQLPDGDFNHSSELVLLDAEGRIVARTRRMGRTDAEFIAAIRRAAGTP